MQRQYGPVPTQGELFLAMNSQGTIMQVFGYFNNNSGAYVCYPPSSVGTSLLKKYGMTFDDTDGLNRSASMSAQRITVRLCSPILTARPISSS